MIKKLILFAALVNCTLTYAQPGSNCDSAVLLTSSQTCDYTEFTTSGPTMWFKFVATSENILVSIVTTQYGTNLPHIHNLGLYQGTCNQLMFEVEKDLPFIDSNDVLSLPLLSYGLQIGQTYYLKAERISHIGACDKTNCLNNQSTDPATFDICVQGIDIIIPPNSTELPSKHHAYEENLGQLKDFDSNPVTDIKAFCNKSTPQVYIADNYTSLVWSKIDNDTTSLDTIHKINLELDKANTPTFLTSEQVSSYNNYYTTQSSQGLLGVKSFSRIILNEIYPEIDQHYYSNEDGLKMYFVVKQGGDPDNIVLKFTGASSTNATSNGGLKINSLLGFLEFKKASVYAIDNLGTFSTLSSSGTFLSLGGDKYSIDFQSYASNLNLIIVIEQEPIPQLLGAEDLEWSTYLGGSGSDAAGNIESDDNGNIYVIGNTESSNFPANGTGVFSSSLTGFYSDGFLTKFSSDYELLWTTYFGGDRQDYATGIARDNVNHITYVSGGTRNVTATLAYTSQPYAANPNSYLDTYNPIPLVPDMNAIRTFVSRFDDQGARQWSSFFINSIGEYIESSLAVDNNGNLYLTGTAKMTNGQIGISSNIAQTNGDHPICYPNSNSYRQFYSGTIGTTGYDGYIMKFDNDLELVWSTFLGSTVNNERVWDIEVDQTREFVYIVGEGVNSTLTSTCPTLNNSGNFPLCDAGAYFQNVGLGGFISRFSLDGEINWSTFFSKSVTGVDTDVNGTIYVTGYNDTDYGPNSCIANSDGSFPMCNAASSYFQSAYAGNSDTYISTFRPTTQLTWSTLIGGSGAESQSLAGSGRNRINVNTNGNIHLYGSTTSRNTSSTTTFPTLSNSNYYFKSTHSDYPTSDASSADTYVMTFSSSKQLLWSTYFGGKKPNASNYGDYSGGIIGLNDRIYICGLTTSNTLFPYHCPTTPNPYCQPSLSGNMDAFVAQLKIEGAIVGLNEESLDSMNEDNISVYPNPNSGEFIVKWNTSRVQGSKISILNQLGQTISVTEVKTISGVNESKINCGRLAPGIYFVNVNDRDSSKTVKIIIQ
jgi:hypothetical protein